MENPLCPPPSAAKMPSAKRACARPRRNGHDTEKWPLQEFSMSAASRSASKT
ncbi:unnamed protein product [Symbiodinium necroappetens]|uniref:Uncharacterized protein n=1 Tax=Symbiodinium necroappetens TaxID=1628268 RepID=A0A812YGB6_9DINO|nr:unnamed protein product [Symbiodinium necroappetens]